MNRRDFLKAIGYSTAAGAAGVALSKLPEMPQERPETVKINKGPNPGIYHLDSNLSTSTAASVGTLQEQVLLSYERAEFQRLRGGSPFQAT